MTSLLIKKCQDPERNNICKLCEKFNEMTDYKNKETTCSNNKNKVKSEHE